MILCDSYPVIIRVTELLELYVFCTETILN